MREKLHLNSQEQTLAAGDAGYRQQLPVGGISDEALSPIRL